MQQVWQEQVLPRADSLREEAPEEAWPILAGTASFGLTLAISTWTQLNLLGVSTGSRPPIPSILGIASVCVASLVSHQAAINVHSTLQQWNNSRGNNSNNNNSLLHYLPPNLQSSLKQSCHQYVPRQEEWNVAGMFQLPMHKVRM